MNLTDALAALRALPDLDEARRRELIRSASFLTDGDDLRRHVYAATAENARRVEWVASAGDWIEQYWTDRAALGAGPATTNVCPPDHAHGASQGCYSSHSCRCEPCRSNMGAERARRRRDAHQPRPVAVQHVEPTKTAPAPSRWRKEGINTEPEPVDLPKGVEHGKAWSYQHHKCRCAACREAIVTVQRERRERKRRAASAEEEKSA